ncbi:MAG: hypothetical protein IMF08_01270 [Proteobacteria bacterium]|nr:hypothetical protein [Pseudomonadota bacterium]
MTVEDVKAALGATEEGSRSKVAIQIIAGELPAAADQAEAALRASGAGPIFQRAGQLVHIAERPARRNDGSTDQQQAIVAIDPPALAEQLAKAAGFEKFDARQKDWRTIDPPVKLIDLYFARSCWRLPDLHQLIGAPTLRTDGSVLARPGYDPETGLYLLADLLDLTVPDKPSYRQAEAANEALTAMFSSFPLVDEPPGLALGVALAGLVGAVLRPTLPACPLIGVTAPAAGTGKSYLVDLISIIATGRRAAGVATGSKPEEFEKSLGAALLEGRPLLCLDNMVQPLAGQMLCMTLSQERVAVRILGQSRSVEVPSAAGLFATGNNLTIRGDMARRTLLCRLDAGVEYPEDRAFDSDILAEARRRRGELVSAVLTIAKWHQMHRNPTPLAGRRFAGYETWCERVRDPLLALGHRDPVEALDVTRAADVEGVRLATIMDQWEAAFGDMSKTCSEAIKEASERDSYGEIRNTELCEALAGATGDRSGMISARKLSHYLARHEGRIIDGRRFQRDGERAKVVTWRLCKTP